MNLLLGEYYATPNQTKKKIVFGVKNISNVHIASKPLLKTFKHELYN